LQLEPRTRVTQPQVGLSAHSASQLQAPPPARSSQYQPPGQMPLPHLLQVPSSQLGPLELSLDAALSLAASSSSRSRLRAPLWLLLGASGALAASSPADLGPSADAAPPPHWGSNNKAKQQRKRRILASVYVP